MKEYNSVKDIFSSRKSTIYNHKIKQKYFTSYASKIMESINLEYAKQDSIYVGINSNGKIKYNKINKDKSFSILLNAYLFAVDIYANISLFSKEFTRLPNHTIQSIMMILNI